MEKSSLLTIIEQDLKDTGTCRLSLAKKPWGMSQTAFALRKFSPVTQIFNYEYNKFQITFFSFFFFFINTYYSNNIKKES